MDITNETVRLESNDKGRVTGRHYSGVYWDTVEGTMLADGTGSLTIRYLHITNKDESVMGTGTEAAPNQRGIARVTAEGTMWTSALRLSNLNGGVTAEGTMWTSALRLSNLNGGRWKIEGEVNTIKETVEVRGNLEIANL